MEESRAVKKRKIDAELTTQEYIMRLKDMIQAMDRNCTVCMVTNSDASKEHNHIANYCPDLDFCAFQKMSSIMIHRPICTCCHIPQIDDGLHK